MRVIGIERGVAELKRYLEAMPSSNLADAIDRYFTGILNRRFITWIGLFEERHEGIERLFICLRGDGSPFFDRRGRRDPYLAVMKEETRKVLSIEQDFFSDTSPSMIEARFNSRRQTAAVVSGRPLWSSVLS